MVFNSSLLLLLLEFLKKKSNININVMDIKRHMLISFFISMLVGKGKESLQGICILAIGFFDYFSIVNATCDNNLL
jgi:hypothetical protein